VSRTFCVVGGFRLLVANALPGSLLLGAYDGDELRFVGRVNGFTEARRVELMSELQPYVTDLAGHPWENQEVDDEWVPLRPELVCEIDDTAAPWLHFVRWRPDVRPQDCRLREVAPEPSRP
jgi:ATP-dependent DNA ligase